MAEFLDNELTAKFVAENAGHVLGLLISKCKPADFPIMYIQSCLFLLFLQLFVSVVSPVIIMELVYGISNNTSAKLLCRTDCAFFFPGCKYTPVAAS